MDTKPFKPLYDGDGPFSSAYLPTPGNEADAAHRIELTWRELREDLAGQGAPEPDLRAIDGAVCGPAATSAGHGSEAGLAIFASQGTVVLDRELSAHPVTPRATFGDLPDAVTLLAQLPDLGNYLVVHTDREGAQIELHARGRREPEQSEQVKGRTYPVSKNTSGDWRQDRRQRTVQNTWRANARDIAWRVGEIAARHGVDLIAVNGDVRARTMLRDELGASWHDRVVDAADGAERVAAEFECAWRAEVVDHFAGDLANGTAVDGLTATVDALRTGDVATLLVRHDAPDTGAPVWWGPEPGQLTLHPRELEDLRANRIKRGRAADVLIRALVQTDGELLLCSGAEPGPSGVAGAILRRG